MKVSLFGSIDNYFYVTYPYIIFTHLSLLFDRVHGPAFVAFVIGIHSFLVAHNVGTLWLPRFAGASTSNHHMFFCLLCFSCANLIGPYSTKDPKRWTATFFCLLSLFFPYKNVKTSKGIFL